MARPITATYGSTIKVRPSPIRQPPASAPATKSVVVTSDDMLDFSHLATPASARPTVASPAREAAPAREAIGRAVGRTVVFSEPDDVRPDDSAEPHRAGFGLVPATSIVVVALLAAGAGYLGDVGGFRTQPPRAASVSPPSAAPYIPERPATATPEAVVMPSHRQPTVLPDAETVIERVRPEPIPSIESALTSIIAISAEPAEGRTPDAASARQSGDVEVAPARSDGETQDTASFERGATAPPAAIAPAASEAPLVETPFLKPPPAPAVQDSPQPAAQATFTVTAEVAVQAASPAAARPGEPGIATRGRTGEMATPSGAAGAPTEAVRYLGRARTLIASGNIAAARPLLELAGEGGSRDALTLLAQTYDPASLQRWGVVGVRPDAEMSRRLLERAAQTEPGRAGR